MVEAVLRDNGHGAVLDEMSVDPVERRRRELRDRAAFIGALGDVR